MSNWGLPQQVKKRVSLTGRRLPCYRNGIPKLRARMYGYCQEDANNAANCVCSNNKNEGEDTHLSASFSI